MDDFNGDEIWTVYLAGETATAWRDRIAEGVEAAELPVDLTGPVGERALRDTAGVRILGPEDSPVWRDMKAARLNAIRTRTMIEKADIVVVRFGDKGRQWSAAFEAGYAAAVNTPLIVLHDRALTHALKDVDAAALAVAETPEQVVQCLAYVIDGQL